LSDAAFARGKSGFFAQYRAIWFGRTLVARFMSDANESFHLK
jgi:hypothetical protein